MDMDEKGDLHIQSRKKGFTLSPFQNSTKEPSPCVILGIETSCDETAAAVVENGRRILGHVISSQVDLHARYGGVVPEIASRHHLTLLNPLIDEALEEAGLKLLDVQAVAVSHGPGLVGALLVGVATAKALAYGARLPLIAVNHLQAHLYANHLSGAAIAYPAVILVVSGGHTELLRLDAPGAIVSLGRTLDDAAGEVFDKVARIMELGYPGGPLIDRLAREGGPRAVDFPRAWLGDGALWTKLKEIPGKSGAVAAEKHSDTIDPYQALIRAMQDTEGGLNLNFSFSGLKTAVINHLYHARRRGEKIDPADLAASFQEALVEVLVEKTAAAACAHSARTVLMAGGVAANSHLRRRLHSRLANLLPTVQFHYPPPELCTDNAAMIAAAAYPLYLEKRFAALDLNAKPGLLLEDSA